MNREIKFRAWNRSSESWEDFSTGNLQSDDDPYRLSLLDTTMYKGEPQVVFQQYTGLKDKNGVEIYEGDIVRALTERVSSSHSTWYQRTNEHHGGVTLDMQVVWNEEKCKFSLRLCRQSEREQKEEPVGKEKQYQHVHVPIDMYDRKCCVRGEVIGNIYESSDLLER